jgi:dsDNA-specific endonuclease/ATPase MutS2
VYVEPFNVVEATNHLHQLGALLREEEGRVCTALCRTIFQHADEVRRAVRAVAEVDVLTAKALLGIKLGGVIPEVRFSWFCTTPCRQSTVVAAIFLSGRR